MASGAWEQTDATAKAEAAETRGRALLRSTRELEQSEPFADPRPSCGKKRAGGEPETEHRAVDAGRGHEPPLHDHERRITEASRASTNWKYSIRAGRTSRRDGEIDIIGQLRRRAEASTRAI